ncbi:hypothetical protein MNB_SV-4-1258 [hydrothermal vent metagenome]|uniref:Coenzyme PQQ synthesis protein D (PqqD) n=1 Tax=hydrothermal vent metagenome TaxID=652676 RepID=A0A1W1E862_9ZZZZ
MDINSRVILNQNIFAQEVDGEMVLLDMQSENYFGMDAVGTSIWQALKEEGGEIANVLERLSQMYDADRQTLQKDLLAFVENLEKNGLVTKS